MNWCIVAVLLGDKYKKFGELFCHNYSKAVPHQQRPEIILLVDTTDGINVSKYDFVTLKLLPEELVASIDTNRTFGTGTVINFDYSLKRFGFQAGLDAGYTDICFIDADMMIRKWDPEVFNKCNVPGLWAGRGYPSSGFGTKPVDNIQDVKFTPKLTALKKELQYETNWVKYKMPFEAVMFLTGIKKPLIQKFIDCWGYVSDATKKLNLPKNKVTHEIGLAADMCNIPIHYNKELLSIVFKHYIMNHDVLLDIYKSQVDDIK